MAWPAGAVRQLAHHLHADEPLIEEGRAGSGVRAPPEGAGGAPEAGGGVAGQHRREGASRRDGGPKKNGAQSIGKSRAGWTTKIHLVAADACTALTFSLSPGNAGDAPERRGLLEGWGPQEGGPSLLMDRAYEGDETRQLALDLGFRPAVPPKRNRLEPWEYNRELYRRRNEVERLFRRLKGFRRIFTRFEKLDALFIGFIHFALITEALIR